MPKLSQYTTLDYSKIKNEWVPLFTSDVDNYKVRARDLAGNWKGDDNIIIDNTAQSIRLHKEMINMYSIKFPAGNGGTKIYSGGLLVENYQGNDFVSIHSYTGVTLPTTLPSAIGSYTADQVLPKKVIQTELNKKQNSLTFADPLYVGSGVVSARVKSPLDVNHEGIRLKYIYPLDTYENSALTLEYAHPLYTHKDKGLSVKLGDGLYSHIDSGISVRCALPLVAEGDSISLNCGSGLLIRGSELEVRVARSVRTLGGAITINYDESLYEYPDPTVAHSYKLSANMAEGLVYHRNPTAKLFAHYTDNENACAIGYKLEVSDNTYTQTKVQLNDVTQIAEYGFIQEPGDSEPDAEDFITQRINYILANRIQPKTTLSPSGSIATTLKHWNVYKILNDGNAIDLTSLVVQDGATAELWIVFGSTVPSVTWPSDLVWDTSAAPTFAANKLYCVALRNDGNRTIGSVEYAITPPTTITGDTDGYPGDIDTIPWIDTRVRNVIDTYTPNRVTLTGTTITEYFRNNTYYILDTTGSAITMSFTAQPGESCELWIDIHSSIPSITWPSNLVWATGSVPQFTANTRNCIVIRNDGSCTIANFAYKYTI